MTHQSQLENKKYRNWVKAGLGLKYTKEGLEPFCDDLVKQQHADILNRVKQKRNLSSIICGQCDIKSLQPDHVRSRNRQCPLGQGNCNCQHPGGKNTCPNNVCSSVYDEIIQLHESRAPYWKNTDARLWCSEPWAVGKCFINVPGYQTKLKAPEFDCSALLHVLLNNLDFFKNAISGTALFKKVLQHRNDIFHSHSMELEDNEVTVYIDDMIAVLEDRNTLCNKNAPIAAVHKLRELKSDEFIITNIDESEVRKASMKAINEKEKELEQKLKDAKDTLDTKTNENKSQIEQLGSDIKAKLALKKSEIKYDTTQTGNEVKDDLLQTGVTLRDDLEQIGRDTGKEVKDDLLRTGVKLKDKLEQIGRETGKGVNDDLLQTGVKLKDDLEQIGKKTGNEVKDDVLQTGVKLKDDLEQIGRETGKEVNDDLLRTGVKLKDELEQIGRETGKGVKDDLLQTGVRLKDDLEQIGRDTELNLEQRMKKFDEKQNRLDAEQKNRTPQSEQFRPVHTPNEYIQWKAGFREKLVGGYKKYAIKASALPLQPEKYQREVNDVYVPQWMTVETDSNEESGKTREISISMHALFRNEEKPAKNIFVLGEAGSGKSTFCKILIYYWCLAHSGHVHKSDEANIMKELNNYEFLFYVALRHYPHCSSIELMLKEIHHAPNLITLLQKESEKCLILLDGLDEWTPQRQCSSQFQTSGLPARNLFADYTIITTSREWKFDTLRISDSEVDKKAKLKGISDAAIIDLSEKTVETLNNMFHKNKVADDFKTYLNKSPVANVKHVPMILQQLVCLWFDDKLKGTSRCAVYSSMLDLFFDWKTLKASANQEDVLPPTSRSELRLPEFFKDYEACVDNNYSIYHLSHLAFETLFDEQQESCLTFSNSTFQALNIPDNVIAYGLKIGILSEDQSVCLFASRRQPSSFSFVHKSLQEYLAAVFVAIQYETKSQSSGVVATSDIGKHTEDLHQFVSKYFKSCTSVTAILKQSNVFIMLSGLEPQLLPYISEYIYHIATSDNQMIQGRKLTMEISDYCGSTRLQDNIQVCIESCMKEVLSREIEFENSVYIADVVFRVGVYNEQSFTESRLVRLNNVLSLNITIHYSSRVQYMQQAYSVLNYLSKCDSLQSIKCYVELTAYADKVKFEKKIIELIDKNSQTLTTVCLNCFNRRIVQSLIQNLSHLHHLTSLQINAWYCITIPHEYCKSLCEYLEQSTQLQQIRLYVSCDMGDKHLIDLTKLNQLQDLHVSVCSIVVTRFSSDNIQNCTLDTRTIDTVKHLLDPLCNACNLNVLSLWCSYNLFKDNFVTDNLTRMLPSLTSLNTLELNRFVITDNTITRPSDMKHLERVKLWSISMSLPTWRKFIDSLPALPKAVRVTVHHLGIMDSSIMGKDDYMYSRSEPDTKENTAARQYVRERKELFQVTKENEYYFHFVTKKAQI